MKNNHIIIWGVYISLVSAVFGDVTNIWSVGVAGVLTGGWLIGLAYGFIYAKKQEEDY